LFTKRREEFQFAMVMHTTLGVDEIDRKLAELEKTAEDRMKILLEAFERFTPPDQKELRVVVKKRGGTKGIVDDDEFLESLMKQAPASTADGRLSRTAKVSAKPYSVVDLKEDLLEDLDTATEKNMKAFSQKMDIQTRHIEEEIDRITRRESNRVIAALTSGPHDKVDDYHVRQIWKNMGWKGSVKARHFVIALRDYFTEKQEADETVGSETARDTASVSAAAAAADKDSWALFALSVQYLQPILEAFDDDGSSWITVAEVNRFTTSRPSNWSLLKWIAYWAAGVKETIATHAVRIRGIFDEMYSLLPRVKEENRAQAVSYLNAVWSPIITIGHSLQPGSLPEMLSRRFKSYAKSEMGRVRKDLDVIKYQIDGLDTLSLVVGTGRIEKSFFPIVRVLLERHLQVFHVACTRVLDEEELADAAESLLQVDNAMEWRLLDLKDVAVHQSIDPSKFFKNFAFGIVRASV